MPSRPPQHRNPFAPVRKPDERRGTAAQRGYDADWRAFRLAYLRANPVCVFHDHPEHKHECRLAATIVDHVKPLSQGGARLDVNNVRSVCREAHDRITNNLKAHGINEISTQDKR